MTAFPAMLVHEPGSRSTETESRPSGTQLERVFTWGRAGSVNRSCKNEMKKLELWSIIRELRRVISVAQ